MAEVEPWADSLDPAGSLGALYSALESSKPDNSHGDYRSLDDAELTHRAGVRWATPTALREVRVRFASMWVPRDAALWANEDAPRRLASLTARDQVIPLGLSVRGLFVRQEARGGSAEHPGQLRIERLVPVPTRDPPLAITLHRRGGAEVPSIPVAQDRDPGTVLDAGDSITITVEARSPVAALRLVIPRVGTSGSPTWLRRWLQLESILDVPCRRYLDAGAGVVTGRSTVWLVPEDATTTFRIVMPTARPYVLGITEIRAADGPPTGAEVLAVPGRTPLPRRTHGPDPALAWVEGGTIDSAEALLPPVAQAASMGIPGTDERLGIAPDGGLLLRRVSGYTCIAMAVDGERPGDQGPWQARWVVPARILVRLHRVAGVRIEQRLTLRGEGVDLKIRLWAERTKGERRVELSVEAAAFDWLTPRPLGPMPIQPMDDRWERREGLLVREVTLFGGEDSEVNLTIPLGESTFAGFDHVLGETVPVLLPHPRWDALLPCLLAQAATFVRADDRVHYGIFPSLYDPDVFGLEEEYLLHGLAMWGCTDFALRSFRATYLQAEHLDKNHYLHDLRNGLTPWQTERLLTLCGLGWSDLDDRERDLLEGTERWLADRLESTASGEFNGGSVIPGLLPPYRYGGDVDFPTQSLTLDAVNAMGRRALRDLRGEEPENEYKRRILAALDGLYDERQSLHTGPEDPGDYLQLLAAGILGPLDFFDRDDERPGRLFAQLHSEGRMAMGLPRFDGWGEGESIDAVYCLGTAMAALRGGDLRAFHTTLVGLQAAAMDRTLHTFREVGPLPREEKDPLPQCWLPGRRLDRTEPCLGSLGVLLQLLRSAVVTELPEADGRLGRRLLVLGGIPAAWWERGELRIEGAPTRAGRVTVVAKMGAGLQVRVDAPGADAVVIRSPDGALHDLPGGCHEVTL
jgi:hypothetical protein